MRYLIGISTLLAVLLLASSCSSTQSGATLYTPAAIPQIQRVGIAPIAISELDKTIYQNVELIMPQILYQGLDAKELFELIPVETFRASAPVSDAGSPDLWQATGKELGLDAVIFSSIEYSQQRIPGLNALDANVELRMVDLNSEQNILISTYNTADTKKYGEGATPEKVTFDATVGAMRLIIKSWQDNM